MPLFENLPYTNFENINLDMILMDIKTMGQKYDELDGRLDELEASYTIINQQITNIQQELDDIDLSGLEARVDQVEIDLQLQSSLIDQVNHRVGNLELDVDENTTNITTNTTNITNNNIGSVNRDNALSARIAALEAAKIHDVYNYYTDGNLLIFGSDLRKMPSYCLDGDGYAYCYGNPHNRTQNQTVVRSFKFTNKGLEPNSDSTSSYDTYQCGVLPKALGIVGQFTVTLFCSSATNDNPTGTWYKHTFSNRDEVWTLATGCTIKVNDWQSWTEFSDYCAVGLQGSASAWSTFLNGKGIQFMYVEWGTGSVDTSTGAKPKLNCKDRNFFVASGVAPTPVIPAPTQYDFNRTVEITLNCTDPSTGSEYTFTGDVKVYFYLWSYNGMLNGYAKLVFPTSNTLYTYLSQYATSFTVQFNITNENLTRQIHQVPMTDSHPLEGHYCKMTMMNGSGANDPIEKVLLQWEATPFSPSEVIENVGYVVANVPFINLIR